MVGVSTLPPSLIDLLKFNRGFHLERWQLFPHPTFVPGLSPQGAFVPPKCSSDTNVLSSRERREVVIFSPTQLAEGFSVFPVNGGEILACGSGG